MNESSSGRRNVLLRARRGFKSAVVPHEDNEYRPHAIRRFILTVILATIVAVQLLPSAPVERPVSADEPDMTGQRLLEATNERRLEAGVTPLSIDKRLTEAATAKANHMFELQYWAHTAPDGTTPWYWLRQVDYRYVSAGENLAEGFSSSNGIISAWMESPEHRQNLLNPDYRHVGFAVVNGTLSGKATELVVAMYGSPIGSSGQETQTTLEANGEVRPIARIGLALQSMTPTTLATIVLLLSLTVISLWAHAYRGYLPDAIRRTWRRHHGLYKAIITVCFVAGLIMLYGGGKI